MEKSKIENLIDSFETFEVAFLLKYRLAGFMKPTQEHNKRRRWYWKQFFRFK